MGKRDWKGKNDFRPDYDFTSMKNGIRGKYVKRFRSGTGVVLLELAGLGGGRQHD